jgi:hypothetical protein
LAENRDIRFPTLTGKNSVLLSTTALFVTTNRLTFYQYQWKFLRLGRFESHPLRHLSPQLARWYPFLPSGDTPEQQKIQHKLAERLQKLGGMTPELSKKIGFGGE